MAQLIVNDNFPGLIPATKENFARIDGKLISGDHCLDIEIPLEVDGDIDTKEAGIFADYALRVHGNITAGCLHSVGGVTAQDIKVDDFVSVPFLNCSSVQAKDLGVGCLCYVHGDINVDKGIHVGGELNCDGNISAGYNIVTGCGLVGKIIEAGKKATKKKHYTIYTDTETFVCLEDKAGIKFDKLIINHEEVERG